MPAHVARAAGTDCGARLTSPPGGTARRSPRTWRLGPVTDQGAMPSCVGHAWAGWLAASPVRQRPIVPDGLYALAQHYDEWQGTDYEGAAVRGAAKPLRVTGHILEDQWA